MEKIVFYLNKAVKEFSFNKLIVILLSILAICIYTYKYQWYYLNLLSIFLLMVTIYIIVAKFKKGIFTYENYTIYLKKEDDNNEKDNKDNISNNTDSANE